MRGERFSHNNITRTLKGGGDMRTYTTCPGCGEGVLHLRRRDNTHAACTDPRKWIDDLEDQFLAAATADSPEADILAGALDRATHPAPRYRDAALAYAAWGWPVHPLAPGSKVPATRHGFRDASTDPDVVGRWWTVQPTANIGLATGIAFDVLDVDMYVPGAALRWADLRDSGVLPTAHGIVSTARGGLHVYLRPTGEANAANVFPGADYRGKGGYVVGPPSRLDDAHPWAWTVHPSPYITTQQDAEVPR